MRNLPQTSHDANVAATTEMRNDHHRQIINALTRIGVGTYEEIADFVGLDKHQVGRRLKEMEERQIVYKPGGTKKTKKGRSAFVYQLTGAQPKTDEKAKAKPKAKVKSKKLQIPRQLKFFK